MRIINDRSILFCVLFLLYVERSLTNGQESSIKAILNGTAFLPCDLTPPIKHDRVLLVIWYTEDLKPIYSLDCRDGFTNAFHWKDEKRFHNRAYFRTTSEPAVLFIENLHETDEGVYRCRVDFVKSPTRNSKLFLTIIIPPNRPIILTEQLKEINTMAGPYEEGSDVKLICKVIGGKPPPEIKWKRDESIEQISEVQIPISEEKAGYRLKELTIHNLNRTNLYKSLVCQASNNNINHPVSTSVLLDIYFKPMNVSIVMGEQSVSIDREYKIVCQTVGSRPEAIIEWWKEGHRLTNVTEQILDDGNVTLSTLTLRPSMKDHNKTLVCRSFNPKLPHAVREASLLIDVTFPPSLKLYLGRNMNPEDIEEGDDVYFECKVVANPAAYKVEWWHNGVLIPPTGKQGIVVVNHAALILQHIKRQMAGNYTCSASSVEGDGKSNIVQLLVMYKPVCKPNQKYIYGVGKDENAHVICEVDSYPLPDSYKWLFNHTKRPIPESRYSAVDNRRGISILTFSPQTELDYGILMCSATNSVGTQTEPCLFHIIPAGQPDPPYNCTVYNQTTDSIEITCKEGFDGGQTQHFVAEVEDATTGQTIANLTSGKLIFKVNRLSPGKFLRMNIYAANVRGKSEPILIETATLGSAQKQTGISSNLHIGPLIGILIVLIIVLCILSPCIVSIIRDRRQSSVTASTVCSRKCKFDKSLTDREEFSPRIYDIDEKTPDVIQCNNNKGLEYDSRTTSADPIPPVLSENFEDSDCCVDNTIIPNGGVNDNLPIMMTSKSPTSHQDQLEGFDDYLRGSKSSIKWKNRHFDHQSVPPNLRIPTAAGNNFNALSPDTIASDCTVVTSIPPLHREVITVRTPLLTNQQESCV